MGMYAENPTKPGQTVVLEYMLTALAKLATRFPLESDRIRTTIRKFEQSISLELQQRSCEYQELLTASWDSHRAGVFDRMPVEKINLNPREDDEDVKVGGAPPPQDLLVIDDLDNGVSAGATKAGPAGDLLDILDSAPAPASASLLESGLDIFGMTSGPAAPVATNAPQASSLLDDLLGGLGAPATADAPPPIAVNGDSVDGFDKDGLKITFHPTKMPSTGQGSCCSMTVRFHNATTTPFENFSFEAAVPKYLQLSLQPASSTTVQPYSSDVSQVLTLVNSTNGEKPVLMRLRISYVRSGSQVSEMGQVANFPQGL